MESLMTKMSLLLVLTVASAVAACDNNPAKDKPTATVAAPVEAPATPAAAAKGNVAYAITPQNSKVNWTGAKVTGKHDGTFTAFTGSVDVVDGSIETSHV